jgi:two-component system, sensor histidine kinase
MKKQATIQKITQDAHRVKMQSDLMQDPQVRAVIKENLFRGMVMGPVVVSLGTAIFWQQFVQWPEPRLLIVILLAWWLNSILYFVLYLYHRRQPVLQRQLPHESARYLKLLTINRCIDSSGLGIITLLLYKLRPDWALVEVVGMIMYMYGTFIKNMSYAKVTVLLPTLMILPMTIAFFMIGDAIHITLAIYFILNALGLTVYAPNIAAIIQLPIKQRFELENLTRQLNIERDRADTANAAKSHFFTAASHDARQPLQVISLLFQSFQKSTQASSQDKKIIEKIDVNLKTIRNLFDRVLDISRIDAGNVTPHFQPINLQAHFDKLDAQFGELAASKGLWLRFVPTDAWVQHDSELLDRIVSNLVHNAIKYTPEGGVWVAWRSARGRLEVRDSGLGIGEANQQTIFDEFAQINNPARNNEAGLGLGLSIVKRLADLTQTPLGLNSRLDLGSTFWLKLQTTTSITGALKNQAIDSLKAADSTVEATVEESSAVSASNSNALAGIHILYCEDESQIRELFTDLLRTAGAVVYPCADVHEAKAVLNTALAVDIVLTDYRLGTSGTGLDVVDAARSRSSDHDASTLPSVIFTGDTAVKDLLSIQQLNNSTLLHKPVDFEHLAHVLVAVAKNK